MRDSIHLNVFAADYDDFCCKIMFLESSELSVSSYHDRHPGRLVSVSAIHPATAVSNHASPPPQSQTMQEKTNSHESCKDTLQNLNFLPI